MLKGKKQKINWREYRTDKFTLPNEMGSGTQCGAYALHAITKKSYDKIEKLGKDGHYPTSTMFKFLKKHGFTIVPITIGNVVESHSVKNMDKPEIGGKNVVLIEQLCYKEESTWSVVYDNKIMHSGDVEELEPLEFINWPVAAAYLIYHKSWR